MIEITMQGGARALEIKQLDLAYRRLKISLLSTLLISALLVAALWPIVAQKTLLTWFAVMWLVMLMRNHDLQSYLRFGHGTGINLKKWKTRFEIGSAVAGIGWGASIYLFLVSPQDGVTVLLLFVIAGVTAVASVSMSTMPRAVTAFLLAALLPLAIWLFSFGERLHYFMCAIVLVYLGLMLLFSRQMFNMVCTSLLITAQNKELSALAAESNHRMSHYFKSAPGCFYTAVWQSERGYAMPFVSASSGDMFGLNPEDVMLEISQLVAMVHHDDREALRRKAWESAHNLTPFYLEFRINHPRKGMRWIEANSITQRTLDGGLRWDGFMHDITDRKRIEAELTDSQTFLNKVIDSIPDPVFVKDREHRWVMLNDACCALIGQPREALIGKTDFDFFPKQQAEVFCGKDEIAFNSGQININEEAITAATGVRRYIQTKKTPFVLNDGQHLLVGVLRDITERKRVEDALAAREQAFRTLVENAPDVVVRYDLDCRRMYVNPAWERVNGVSSSEVIGKTPQEASVRIRPITSDFEKMLRDVMEKGKSGQIDLEWKNEEGELVCFALTAIPEFNNNGNTVSVLTVARDISERRRMEAALTAREQETRTLIQNTPDTIARYDRDCRRTFVNRAFSEIVEGGVAVLLGSTPSECPGGSNAEIYEAKINEVFAAGQGTDFELNWKNKDGKEICSHIRLTPERDTSGTVISVLAIGHDITELNMSRQKIHQMAFYDSLTSLPNRALFNDRLRQLLKDASWHGQIVGVMLLDLDRFKAINDTLGHPAGDELLRETAGRLKNCVRSYDTVARLGGDEFAILLSEIRSGDDLGRIANKILEAFNEPFTLEGKEVFISSSVGLSVYPDDSSDADDLIKQADSAMYFAKRSGRNNFRFYSRDLTASSSERLMLESELRRAVERKELELYYQPKVWLADGVLIGSEALLRWNNPQRGLVSPDQFVSIAEDSGLIVGIGEWVLHEACRTACNWNGPDKPLHKVAINLSARQFQSNCLLKTVSDALEMTGCHPEWIELEITESLLLDEYGDVLEILESFQSMGISIAIDDFGTGYSALSYLARYPINTLKIDRSFIRSVTTDKFRSELVKAIISIAKSLGQTLVAEGVETDEQAAFLQTHGCQIAQGYLYSKPITKSAFELLPQSYV